MAPLKVFVGFDETTIAAYKVCIHSLTRLSTIDLEIHPLKLSILRNNRMYYRGTDPLASTEFTYSRFLVPRLCNFKGWSLYIDNDFLFLDDVANLVRYVRACELTSTNAVYCVQHDYRPTEETKMGGKVQTRYPRKNWSSLMFFNCGHALTKKLTVTTCNEETPKYLHRMAWAKDKIGAIPREWNWLEGTYGPKDGTPKAVHFTRGGPWLPNCPGIDYAGLWVRERILAGL